MRAGRFRSPLDIIGRTKAREEKQCRGPTKVPRTGVEPWSTFTAALAETRAAFDRANQAARTVLR